MKDDIIRDGIQTDGAFHFMTKPNMKLSVFLSIPGRLHHLSEKWPAQHQAAPSFVRFQTEVRERDRTWRTTWQRPLIK